jgi:hypothetical protein
MRSSQSFHSPDRNVAARDLDDEHDSSAQRIGRTTEGSEYYAASPPVAPRSYPYARYSGYRKHQFANIRPSTGKRMSRTIARFFLAVLIGVGGTLAWQSYGDEATGKVRIWVPSLAHLLPVSAMGSSAAAASLADVVQQLKPMSLDLAIVRRSLDQLAAKQDQLAASQDQISQNVAALQEVEHDFRQETSSLPSSHTVHIPPSKPQPSR